MKDKIDYEIEALEKVKEALVKRGVRHSSIFTYVDNEQARCRYQKADKEATERGIV